MQASSALSFRPSRFRSHSRSTGASLLFRFLSSASLPGFSACFPLSFVRFSLLLTTQPSALSFPFFPFSPGSSSSGACFPLPSGLFPCLPSDSGTQLSAFPFSARRFASQWLPQRLSLLPYGFRPFPLGFRFRFWLLGLEHISMSCPLCVPAANMRILAHDFRFVNNYFKLF